VGTPGKPQVAPSGGTTRKKDADSAAGTMIFTASMPCSEPALRRTSGALSERSVSKRGQAEPAAAECDRVLPGDLPKGYPARISVRMFSWEGCGPQQGFFRKTCGWENVRKNIPGGSRRNRRHQEKSVVAKRGDRNT
jgi:hypothetical protein